MLATGRAEATCARNCSSGSWRDNGHLGPQNPAFSCPDSLSVASEEAELCASARGFRNLGAVAAGS